MKKLFDIQTLQNSLLPLDVLLTAVSGNLLYSGNSQFSFTHVACDSRKVEKGTLFFPLVGENQDGHKYIYEAEKKRCFSYLC